MNHLIFSRKNRIKIYLLIIVTFCLLLLFRWLVQDTVQEAVPILNTPVMSEDTLYLYGFSTQTAQLDTISWWYSSQDQFYYFFLPAEAKGRDVHVAFLSNDENNEIIWGASSYHSGDVVAELCEGAITVTMNGTTYPIRVLYGDEITTMMINTDSGSMEDVDNYLGLEEAGSIYIHDTATTFSYEGDLSYIRGRGNSSFGLDKKSYQIKLPEDFPVSGMTKSKKWILLPQYYDYSALRNALTFDLAEYLGLNYTAEYRFTNLYLNGSYQGLYLLTEKVEVDENRINIRNLDTFYNQNPTLTEDDLIPFGESEYVISSSKGYDIDCSPADVTGGYLLELELEERYAVAGDCGFVSDRGQAVIIKSPKYATKEEVSYIQNWYQEYEDALFAEDGINPDNGKHYTDYIDMDSVVAKYLLEEWILNPDAGKTSQYFYKPSDAVSTKMYAGPVWDYDLAYAALVAYSHPEGFWASYPDDSYNMYAALYKHDDFLSTVKEMYQKKILPYLDENVSDFLTQKGDRMLASAYMSNIRWQRYNSETYKTLADYKQTNDNDIAAIPSFLQERSDFLSAVWLDGKVYHTVTVDTTECDYFYLGTDNQATVLDGQCVYFLDSPAKYNYTFTGWRNQKTGEAFDLDTPIMEDGIILEPVFEQ